MAGEYPVTLIIDANNLLLCRLPQALLGLDEAQLCRLAGQEATSPNSATSAAGGVFVVCDAAPGPLGLLTSPSSQAELIYAGHGKRADDIIIALIQADHAPRRLTVVTNDLEIRQAARRRRARILSSEDYAHQLTKHLGRDAIDIDDLQSLLQQTVADDARENEKEDAHPSPRRNDGLPPEDVADWLHEFGIDDADHEADDEADDDDKH